MKREVLAGHAACLGQTKNAYKIWLKSLMGKENVTVELTVTNKTAAPVDE
jgi:hypothetical protein